MPKQLTKQDVDSGLAVVLKKASPAKLESKPEDVLKGITSAISSLVDLHRTTQAILKNQQNKPPHESIAEAALVVALQRLSEIHALTQKTMETIRDQKVPSSEMKEVELTVTERDAYGRIMKIIAVKKV